MSQSRRAPPSHPAVLVVDDDSDFRNILAWTLEDEGYRVLAARDGQNALELLLREEELPSLILLDLLMARMDGWTLRRELERRFKDANLPIVVMTAAHAQTAELLNVAEVLEK